MKTRSFHLGAITRALTLMLALFPCLTVCADEAVLGLFVGEWEVRVKTTYPKESEDTYRETYEWTLDRRFVKGETTRLPNGALSAYYGTYDPISDTYPFWAFSSAGTPSLWAQGKWDARNRTLLFKSPPISDTQIELIWEFPDDHTRRWTLVSGNMFGTQLRQEGVAVQTDAEKVAAAPPAASPPAAARSDAPAAHGTSIEQLTPQLLGTLHMVANVVVPILTLILSAPLLWRYRRSVLRQMQATVGFGEAPPYEQEHGGRETRTAEDLFQRALRGPRLEALRYATAGFAVAVAVAFAARFVYPIRVDLYGFAIAVVIYAWPIVPTLFLILPATWRLRSGLVGGYFALLFLLSFEAGAPVPANREKVDAVQATFYPFLTLWLWFEVNAVPTLAVILCYNRWARPVAPLVLGFVAMAVGGIIVAFLGLFSRFGFEGLGELADTLRLHSGWLISGAILLSLATFCAIGWVLARWVARSYRQGNTSDHSLAIDALYLLFLSSYTMFLLFGGLEWAAIAPVAFAIYKLVLMLGRSVSVRPLEAPRDLTFLRVFSLGRRSERLLAWVASHWRHIGNVQMITGPDIARSVVHPSQFLDFLSGRLARHFVRDPASLERSVAEWNRPADTDGRFAMGNYFCHADSWQHLLPELLRKDDVVLMDLRSFSGDDAGCLHELRCLVRAVPIARFVLVADDKTDEALLARTLHETWRSLPPDSPNFHFSPEDVELHRDIAGVRGARNLVRRLCGISEPGG